jgi:hypothetical protein
MELARLVTAFASAVTAFASAVTAFARAVTAFTSAVTAFTSSVAARGRPVTAHLGAVPDLPLGASRRAGFLCHHHPMKPRFDRRRH